MMNEPTGNSCEKSGMPRTCTLMITHQCNLNCTYCYETHKSNKQMSIELAKELVAKEFELVAKSPMYSGLQIDYIGGEPLLRFDLIKEVAEWAWSNPWPVNYMHFATTNGTLLNDAMKSWFETHKNQFCLGLSLDGSPETHDINRRGSYSHIDLEFFLRLWPGQHIKMTLSKESLQALANDVVLLHQIGFTISFNPANGIYWNEDDADIYENQLNLLADYYIEHPDIEPALAFMLPFSPLLQNNAEPQKYCGTGNYMVTYDVDGTAYPCHMFTPIVTGDNRSEDLKRFDFFGKNDLVDPRCADCAFLQMCPTCYGMNYKYRSHIALRDINYCKMFKRQIKAVCRYKINSMAIKGVPTSRKSMLEAKALLFTNDVFQDCNAII